MLQTSISTLISEAIWTKVQDLAYFSVSIIFQVFSTFWHYHAWFSRKCINWLGIIYENIGMIVVYENQAELPSRNVNYNDHGQIFDHHPLTFSGNLQENRFYNVQWICHWFIYLIRQAWQMQLSFWETLLPWFNLAYTVRPHIQLCALSSCFA